MIICALYAKKSHLKIGHSFWIASALVFFSAVRRELSFLPDLYVPEDFSFLNKSYDWWEDAVLMVVGVTALAYLIHGWRYLWAVLRDISKFIYIATISLVILQYLGEHGIGFSHDLGVLVEEVSEGIIYLIALIYLVRFPLTPFEHSLKQKLPSATRTHSATPK